MKKIDRQPLYFLLTVIGIMLWSFYQPKEMFTWWLEVLPVFLALAVLAATYSKFRFTNFVYLMITLHCAVLLIGAHYTYAEVPLFNEMRGHYGVVRNHYDRLGHFVQGFVPALIARELLLRTSPLKAGKWLFAIILLSCLGISASYEIIEALVSINTGEKADAFLGTQGDIWDTQKDIMMAGIGALAALLLFSGVHDEALKKVVKKKR